MHSERAEHIDLHDTSHMLPAVDDYTNSDIIGAIAPFLEIPTSILSPHDWKVLHSAPLSNSRNTSQKQKDGPSYGPLATSSGT
jgi:hypothetical protein